MSLVIDLPPEAERRLRDRAGSSGIEPARLASILVLEGLGAAERAATSEAAAAADSVRRLFADWAAEDPVTGPDDLRERQREFEEFKAGMNAASLSGRSIYP
jgi:hypothetical protein